MHRMAFSFSSFNQSVQPRDHGSRLLLAGERDVVAAARVVGGDSVSHVLAADRLSNRAMGGGVTASISSYTLAPEVPANRDADRVRTREVKPSRVSVARCNTGNTDESAQTPFGGLNIERGGGAEPRILYNRRHRHTFAGALLSDSRLFSIDGQRAAGAAFRPFQFSRMVLLPVLLPAECDVAAAIPRAECSVYQPPIGLAITPLGAALRLPFSISLTTKPKQGGIQCK